MRALVKYGSRNGEVEVREQPEPSVQPGCVRLTSKLQASAAAIYICGPYAQLGD